MEYIVHHRYKRKTMTGKEINLPYGTLLTCENNILYYDSSPICYITSENAHTYFARNDDGSGLRRGAITYEIAYSNRKRFNTSHTRMQRFTDEEIELLESKYSNFLISDINVILFNHNFFNATISELESMAKDLNIKIPEG